MHISRSLALVAAAAGLALTAPSALAAPATKTIDATTPGTYKADWTGATAVGANNSYFLDGTAPGVKGTCAGDTATPNTACEKTLVHVKGIAGDGSTLTLRIDGFQQYSDFDLRAYESDATGAEGNYLGSPSSDPTATTSLPVDALATANGDPEYKTVDLTQYADATTGAVDAYFLVEVPYFDVPNDKYDGHAVVDAKPFVPATDTGDGSE